MPVPIPDSPLRYVLVYVFEMPGGVVLVDAGWPAQESWDALVAGLAETGHGIADVRGVLVTHMHPDHHGLAGRVREASGAWIGMHPGEAEVLTNRPEPGWLAERDRQWLTERGAGARDLAELARFPLDAGILESLVRPDRLVQDGDHPLAPTWQLRAVWTPGHTPGHLCFHDEPSGLLLSGDHVLPRISPNIAAQGGLADPLGDYLDSLDRVSALPHEEVLPAHEYRFAGLAERVAQLRRHHEARLAEIERLTAAEPGSSTWALAAGLTWSRSWAQTQGPMRRGAVSETLAHLVVLQRRGRVVNTGDVVDRWVLAGG
ncbi:MBL fold metallo-hydrolase [Dactylosporangium sp. NPDC005572]|uniref:MBL fold metallo-hydrolase n=1 Tax=Dactylosporangium sp. NPDC005572 TaxID=3156889 RepID=UPI0033AE2EBF